LIFGNQFAGKPLGKCVFILLDAFGVTNAISIDFLDSDASKTVRSTSPIQVSDGQKILRIGEVNY